MIIKPDSTMEKSPLVNETVWLDKYKYDDAELHYAQERCRGREGYASPMRKAGPQTSGKQAKKGGAAASNKANETQQQNAGKASNKKAEKKAEANKNKNKSAKNEENVNLEAGGLGDKIDEPKTESANEVASTVETIPELVENKAESKPEEACNETVPEKQKVESVVPADILTSIKSEVNETEMTESGSNYSGCETVSHVDMVNHVRALQSETQEIRKILTDVKSFVESLEVRLKKIEGLEAVLKAHGSVPAAKQHAPAQKKEAPKPENKSAGDEDDDLDLFGSDEDEEADAVREQRLKAYQEKKSKKPGPIAKSSVVIDVKPWDDETDMGELEKQVRGIEMDGLVWGASKLVPLAYGIRKLQIVCIVEDEKVSIDELQETIQEMEDLVQSTDIAAFNKL